MDKNSPTPSEAVTRARIRLNRLLTDIRRELTGLEAEIRKLESQLARLTPGTLQEKFVRCGRPGCRCAKGKGHGPYHYLIVKEKGKKKAIYLGREPKLPEGYATTAEHARIRARLEELQRRRDDLLKRLDQAVRVLEG